jgi:hypothetical protein
MEDKLTNIFDLYQISKESMHWLSQFGYSHDYNWRTGANTHRFLSQFEKSKSNSKEDDLWDYYLNDQLFRDEWKLLPTTKKIGFFGCSVTFGIGLPSHQTFPKLVEHHYNSDRVESLNFATPGASISRISKIVRAAITNFSLDLAVITLPSISRFPLMEDGILRDINPMFSPDELKHRAKYFYKAVNDTDLSLIAIDNILLISAQLAEKNIPVLWGSWDSDTLNLLNQVVQHNTILPFLEHHGDMGFARDNSHPGPVSAAAYASSIIDKINNQIINVDIR